MKTITTIARIMLGLVLFIFGLNGFLHFYPLPDTTQEAKAFLATLWGTGYLMFLVKAIEVLCGLSLLLNRYLALSLLILLPVSINIFLVDLFLQPQFAFLGILLFSLHLFLIYTRKALYSQMVKLAL